MIDFDNPINDFPHQKETGSKRCTVSNLRHLFKGYNISVSYDELLKEQTMTLNNDYDTGHSDLIANSNIAHLRSLMSLNGLPVDSVNLLPALFAENAQNPVMDWIESKPWDKKTRIDDLADTLTTNAGDAHYCYLALRTWLIQCVAAADGAKRTPNKDAIAKYELVFVLQGGQGAQKTSWLGRLVPKHLSHYFIDGVHLDPSNIDSIRQANAAWICELGELDSTFKKEVSRLKAFLSKQTDTLRLPYDRAASNLSRRTSFCGSVNPAAFLVDATGNRRFLPVQVISCDHLHTIDMQQLWAEVLELYLSGANWWCSLELEELLVERHERHTEAEPVHEMIAEVFDIEKPVKGFEHKHFTATKIMQMCGIREPKKPQISLCIDYLKRAGFTQVKSSGIMGFWLIKRQNFPD
ncbi:MAG: virulence-associated E family protein [Methylovulum sp.]|nr:virulence-associated E family protein [Methylovulum sp.]